MIRIGIVGCGFIGRVHSYALKALIDTGQVQAAVTEVFDRDPERARTLASVHDAHVAPDLDALIGAVDVVWICTPTATHLPIVTRAAAQGVAILCEKPLGRSLAEATEVAAALESVRHRVGLVLRSSPVFGRLHDELAGSTHGRPMAAVLRDDQWFPLGGMYGSTWRADAEQAGAGTLIEHSIHDLDILRWLLGDPVSVSARTANFAGYQDVEDLAVVDLAFGDGALATLTSIWHRVESRPSTRRLEVFCEDALLWLDDDDGGPLHVETSAGAEIRACPLPDWAGAFDVPAEFRAGLALYAAPAREFLEDLSEGGIPRGPNAADALAAHGIVDAAYRSAKAGGVPLPVGTR